MSEVGDPDGEDAGDAVCWLTRVCDHCGALADGPPADACERCGSPRQAPAGG